MCTRLQITILSECSFFIARAAHSPLPEEAPAERAEIMSVDCVCRSLYMRFFFAQGKLSKTSICSMEHPLYRVVSIYVLYCNKLRESIEAHGNGPFGVKYLRVNRFTCISEIEREANRTLEVCCTASTESGFWEGNICIVSVVIIYF